MKLPLCCASPISSLVLADLKAHQLVAESLLLTLKLGYHLTVVILLYLCQLPYLQQLGVGAAYAPGVRQVHVVYYLAAQYFQRLLQR